MAQKKYQKKLLAKSLVDDSWTLQDVLRMMEGGNHKLIQHMPNLNNAKGITLDKSSVMNPGFFASDGLTPEAAEENDRATSKGFDARYDTKAAGTYRKMISQRVTQVLGMHGNLKV